MARKTQKSLQFSDEVFRWFDEEEQRTGASHSRIALASLLSYICTPEPQRSFWMNLAVQVDRDEANFLQIPRLVAEHSVTCYEIALKTLEDRGVRETSPDLYREFQEHLKRAKVDAASASQQRRIKPLPVPSGDEQMREKQGRLRAAKNRGDKSKDR